MLTNNRPVGAAAAFTTLPPDESAQLFSEAIGAKTKLEPLNAEVVAARAIAAMVAGVVGATTQITAAAAKSGNTIYISRQDYQWTNVIVVNAVLAGLTTLGYPHVGPWGIQFVRSPSNAPNMHAEMVIARNLGGAMSKVGVASAPLDPCPVCAKNITDSSGVVGSMGKPPNMYWVHPTNGRALQKQ